MVLGRPGSGCSTLLKTIANQRGEYHSVEGEVYYDSLSPEEVAKHYRGDVTYCPEDDGMLKHFSEIFKISNCMCHSPFSYAHSRADPTVCSKGPCTSPANR